MDPSNFYFIVNTHLHPTIFFHLGKFTNSYVPLFFFQSVNEICIKKLQKGRITHDVYNNNQKVPKKKMEERTKNYFFPQTDPNQLMKSTMDINLSPINSLVQVNKLHKNKYFSIWIESSTISKDPLYLPFQIV